MKGVFQFLTTAAAVVMVVCILMQSRGASLGAAFGGDSNVFRTKRGAERLVFNATIVAAVVFVVTVVLSILSKS